MKALLRVLALAFCAPAHASPALHGTWSAAIDGQPLVVVFEGNGTGKVNGKPMKWQTLGRLLFVQQQGEQAVGYSFEVKGDKLSFSGGSQLIAHSQRGTVNTYALEKRNHPKNKRDPMICLDGECYVTFYNKAPW